MIPRPNMRARLANTDVHAILIRVVAALVGSILTLLVIYTHSVFSEPNAVNDASAAYTPAIKFSCDFVIGKDVTQVDGKANPIAMEPGSTICMEGGNRPSLVLRNFRGTASHPIKFINKGDQVRIEGSREEYAGLRIEDSEHIWITGTGVDTKCGSAFPDADQKCGIVITGGARGVVGIETGYIEIDHIEISETGNVGMAVRHREDSSIDRSTWTQHDTHLHHNFIHDTGTEGFYVGSSNYREGQDPLLEGVEINHNLLVRNGWDGIQVGSATDDCIIHHNVVLEAGTENKDAQNSGIMNNPGSVCDIYNNLVVKSMNTGIYIQGNGGNRVFNNVIIQPGIEKDTDGDGIVVSKGTNEGRSIYLWNNTIIEPRRYGITFRNEMGDNNLIQDNVIIGSLAGDYERPETYINTNHDNVTVMDNLFVDKLDN